MESLQAELNQKISLRNGVLILDSVIRVGSFSDPLPQYLNKTTLTSLGNVSTSGWYKIGQIKYDPNLTDTTAGIFELRFLLNFDLITATPYDTAKSELLLNYTLSLYTHQDGTTQVIIKRNTNLSYPLLMGVNEPLVLLDVITPLSSGSFLANIYYYNKFSSATLYVGSHKRANLTDRVLKDTSIDMLSFFAPVSFSGSFTRPYYELTDLNQAYKYYITGVANDRYLKLFSFQNGSNARTLIDFVWDDRDTCQNALLRVTNPSGSGVVLHAKQGVVYGSNRLFYTLDVATSTITVYSKILSNAYQDVIFKVSNFNSNSSTLKITDFRYSDILATNLVDASTLATITALPDA
jgi:hypothetical protein